MAQTKATKDIQEIKISEFKPALTISDSAIFPIVQDGDNWSVLYSILYDKIEKHLEGNGKFTLVIDNLLSTATGDALSANQGRILKDLIDNVDTRSFFPYTKTTIIDGNYVVSPTLNYMFRGNIASNLVIKEVEKQTSYGTTFLLLTNTGSQNIDVTINETTNYVFLPADSNFITIAPGKSVQIIIKAYGDTRLVSVTTQDSYYSKDEVDDQINSVKTETDNKILELGNEIQAQIDSLQEAINNVNIQRRVGFVMELDEQIIPIGEPMNIYYFTAKNVATLQIKVNDDTVTDWTDVPLNTTVNLQFDGTKDAIIRITRSLTDATSSIWMKSQTNQ